MWRWIATSRFRSVDLSLNLISLCFHLCILGKKEFCISVGVLWAIHVVIVTLGVFGVAFREYLRAGVYFRQ